MINDYNKYQFTLKENIKCISQGMVIVIILSILFYQSILAILFLSPIIYLYYKMKKRGLINNRRWRLNLEFRDGITALSAALEAGYSSENAFEEALRDLRQLYDKDSIILQEFSYIINQIHMNITIEKALSDFGERTGIEDIQSFAEVFSTAKRTGGDLINVIRISSSMISDKIEVKKEIRTLITAKRLEANIMKLMPLLILIYLSISSSGFLNPLYHNLQGVLIMTVFLACYLGAFLIIDRIIAIEV